MKVFTLTEGDEKRMPVRLTQNGAALAWTPESVTLKIRRAGGCGSWLERTAVAGATAADWYYDWTADDADDFPGATGGARYDCRVVVVKPASVAPGGPETAPVGGVLQIVVES